MFERKDETGHLLEERAAETIVGTSVKLKGNLRSEGDITIDGHVNGDVKTKTAVFIGPNANVVANIKAKNIEIAGVVQGNIEAENRLEITQTGKVFGDIASSVLVVSPGALFTGKCQMIEKKGEEIEFEPLIEEEPEELPQEAPKKK